MSSSSQPKNSYDTLIINGKSIDDILKECTVDLGGTGVNMNDVSITGSYSDVSYTYANNSFSNITLGGNAGAATYTIQPITSVDTITLNGIDNYSAFNIPVEWVDCLPPFSRVQDMCEKYPGLKIAFENFKVFYEMVKDDYDNPTPKK